MTGQGRRQSQDKVRQAETRQNRREHKTTPNKIRLTCPQLAAAWMAEYPVSSWRFTFTPDKTRQDRTSKDQRQDSLQRQDKSSKTRQVFKDKTSLQRQDKSSKTRQVFKDKASLQRQDKSSKARQVFKDKTSLQRQDKSSKTRHLQRQDTSSKTR